MKFLGLGNKVTVTIFSFLRIRVADPIPVFSVGSDPDTVLKPGSKKYLRSKLLNNMYLKAKVTKYISDFFLFKKKVFSF